MTGPIDKDHLILGAVKWLRGFPDVIGVLGTFPDETPYLFPTTLWAVMEGSQSSAAVIYRAGGWAGPNAHNTLRFPRIGLEVYVDPQRDNGNNAIAPAEAERRVDYVYRAIDRRLHRPQNGVQMWGSVRTIGCARLVEPTVTPVPNGDGLLRLDTFYGITEG